MPKAADNLATAAKKGDLESVRRQLDDGVDPDAVGAAPAGSDWRYYTALKIAARSGHVEVVKALLDAGANPEFASRGERETALTTLRNGMSLLALFRGVAPPG